MVLNQHSFLQVWDTVKISFLFLSMKILLQMKWKAPFILVTSSPNRKPFSEDVMKPVSCLKLYDCQSLFYATL